MSTQHYDKNWEEAERRIAEAKRTNASHLDLAGLKLAAIPDSLAELTNLRELSLFSNQLIVIPDSLAHLSNLRKLSLFNNELTAIPDSLARLINLQSLDIGFNQLTTTPDSLGRLTNLQSLALNINQLTTIPDSLGQLTNLQELYLTGNRLTAIPDSLARLTNLEILDLRGNRLTTIPDSLGQLTNLRALHLGSNQLTTIPDSLARLTNLQELYLGSNQLTTIPDSLTQLTSLTDLHLGSNQFTAIPNGLARLSNLRELNLSNNQLTTLPESLQQLQTLTKLYLHGNPLEIPDEILGPSWIEVSTKGKNPKPPREILDYFYRLGESRPLNEAKLIMVGHGAVGKSSLVKKLTTGIFKSGEKATEGIKITDWTCQLGRKDNVIVHIWDFGGQEMMHATHQFFLTQRSLYLLVLNRRQGGADREADYWFRLIRAFGGKDAPVIVVLNKQKSEPFDVNRGDWLNKYDGNIKGFVQTDCTDSESIKLLQEKIEKELKDLKSIKASFPRRWFAIKNELSQMPSQFITFENYRAICKKHKEEDSESQTSLAGFLHDLGIALNYKEDPRLRFAYVLKPEWVTDGIYALLHAFVKTKGLLSSTDAHKVLAPKSYSPEAADFILGLMERFELSFPLSDNQKRILIPQLLDDQQPDAALKFKSGECLNYGYKYSIVPEGLLPRFIVRTHHLSQPAGRWKSGVILQDDTSGCRALVKADSTEGQVRIHVEGPVESRRELLAIIRYNFHVIHSDYEFKPMDLVYPVGAPEKPLHLGDLETLARSGATTAQVVLPNQTVINPRIADLIEPVKSAPPLKLFLSYSHKDEKFVDELRKDLKLMERNGLIIPWYDRALKAGEKWEARILQELNEADAIVCQLSRDFLASDFCVLTELDTAIKRQEAGEAVLIAYVLTECGWKEVPKLGQFQTLPRDAKPLSKWKDKNSYWRAVAEGIQSTLKELQKKLPERRSKLGFMSAEARG